MQMGEKSNVRIYIAVPWMLGMALILGVIDAYMISVVPADSLWSIWSLLALIAFIVGASVGWFWDRWGLLLLLFVPLIFMSIGYLRIKSFYSSDVGWGLPVFLYLIPTLPFLNLGIVLSGFLQTRLNLMKKGHALPL